MQTIARQWIKFLRWTEAYTQTDMVYLVHGSFWLILGKGTVFLIYFLTLLAFANWLPQETYGTYQYIMAYGGLFAIFTLPGINVALIKSIAQKKEKTLSLAITTKLQWGILGMLGMVSIAGWYFLQNSTILAVSFLFAGLLLPLYATFPIFESYWSGKKRFRKKIRYEVATALFSAGITIPVVYFTDNILLVLLAFFGSSILFGGFFLWRTMQQTEGQEQDTKSIAFGKKLTVITAISIAAENIDKILIWKLLGPAQVAVYAFALSPLQKLVALSPIESLALPRLGENDTKEIQKNFIRKFFKGFAATIILAIVLAVCAPVIFTTFFPQYEQSIVYFQVFTILVALTPFALIKAVLVSKMRHKELYTVSIARSVFKVSAYLMLAPFMGIWGIVLGNLLGEILGNTLLFSLFMRSLFKKT